MKKLCRTATPKIWQAPTSSPPGQASMFTHLPDLHHRATSHWDVRGTHSSKETAGMVVSTCQAQ
jgi:hypothetical protein